MNKRLQWMVITIIVVTTITALWGASQAGRAKELPDADPAGYGSYLGQDQSLETATTSENMELLGHLGGMAQAIEVRGQYAYVGIGPEFAILDVSDPANIQRVGWLLAEGEVMDIAIQGDYAYLAYQGQDASGREVPGIQIVRIRYPTMPVTLAVKQDFIGNGVYDCGGAKSLVVQGDSAYFIYNTCDAFGHIFNNKGDVLLRLDVTYPTNPKILDSYTPDPIGSINGIAASEG